MTIMAERFCGYCNRIRAANGFVKFVTRRNGKHYTLHRCSECDKSRNLGRTTKQRDAFGKAYSAEIRAEKSAKLKLLKEVI